MASEGPDLRQAIEEYKDASPEERGQVKALLSFLGMSTEKIANLEAALSPPNAFRDKQKALDDLDRDFGRAVASTADDPQRVQDLKRVYEEERKRYLNLNGRSHAINLW
jgi:hypothetical protein